MNISKTKKLTTIGMLCALAHVAVVVGRIPVVLFLKYDPKDIIIVIGGFIFGPLTSFAVTVIVSAVQMFTISGTGILGCIMNIMNAAITMLLYKPVVTALRRANLIESMQDPSRIRINIGVLFAALLMIITCVLLILSFHSTI